MAEDFIRVFPNKDVTPVNQIVKASKYSEEESGGGGGAFASILENELTKRKDKTSKDGKKAPEEKLKKMEGMNQYDARANAFIYRLSTIADYRA
ncbi:MAG: hypothetical protein VZQ83_03290 [Eubacterium sp.]|nr:hypothetical protein [Eubacterium sp.]